MEGDPRFDDSQTLPDFPYAGYADLLGLTGIRVTEPGELEDAWNRALAADRPVVLEVRTDPDVPLLPPFPAGEQKLDSFRTALDQEGAAGRRARQLLDTYAEQEQRRTR
jgi:pyruvate dehydrogenase (quinone)